MKRCRMCGYVVFENYIPTCPVCYSSFFEEYRPEFTVKGTYRATGMSGKEYSRDKSTTVRENNENSTNFIEEEPEFMLAKSIHKAISTPGKEYSGVETIVRMNNKDGKKTMKIMDNLSAEAKEVAKKLFHNTFCNTCKFWIDNTCHQCAGGEYACEGKMYKKKEENKMGCRNSKLESLTNTVHVESKSGFVEKGVVISISKMITYFQGYFIALEWLSNTVTLSEVDQMNNFVDAIYELQNNLKIYVDKAKRTLIAAITQPEYYNADFVALHEMDWFAPWKIDRECEDFNTYAMIRLGEVLTCRGRENPAYKFIVANVNNMINKDKEES